MFRLHRPFGFTSMAALWILALHSSPAAAQEKKEVETTAVNFATADGVELQGKLYKSVKPGVHPVVMLLHSPTIQPNGKKSGSEIGDWHGLALLLAGEGFNVLRFDFRGHNESFLIKTKADFWDKQPNQKFLLDLYRKNPKPDKVLSTDYAKKGSSLPNGYLPMLVNDVMAARIMLDVKNDSAELNTSSIYIIGAGDASVVGMLYLMAEWDRPQVAQPGVNIGTLPLSIMDRLNLKGKLEWAGKDIAGAIWISPTKLTTLPPKLLPDWAKSRPSVRESNKMLFLYGDGDLPAKDAAQYYYGTVLVAEQPKGGAGPKIDPVRLTKKLGIPKTKLAGVELLGKDLGTEAEILKYLKELEVDRKQVARNARNYNLAPYVDPIAYSMIRYP